MWPSQITLCALGLYLIQTPALAQATIDASGAVNGAPMGGLYPGTEFQALDGTLQELFRPVLMGLFLLETLLTLALSATIAFHPVHRKSTPKVDDLLLPRLYLLYGLIGMAIGFLVTQHGYFIGFVIFGIGGLLRFRSTLDDSSNTVEVIVVTLIGLCVGLNLPIMGILIAAAAFGIIWMTGIVTGYEISLRSINEEDVEPEIKRLTDHLNELGWPVIAVRRSLDKFGASILFRAKTPDGHAGVERKLTQVINTEKAIWKIKK
ncbi:MAG: hypothetical protein WCD16_11245 [Paracoccaceae bacterium]